MRLFLKAKGQGTAEYAIIIALVVGALMAMQVYIRRGLNLGIAQAMLKTTGIDAQHVTPQYEPYYLQSEYNTTSGAYKEEEDVQALGNTSRYTVSPVTTTRSGNQTITAVSGQN